MSCGYCEVRARWRYVSANGRVSYLLCDHHGGAVRRGDVHYKRPRGWRLERLPVPRADRRRRIGAVRAARKAAEKAAREAA